MAEAAARGVSESHPFTMLIYRNLRMTFTEETWLYGHLRWDAASQSRRRFLITDEPDEDEPVDAVWCDNILSLTLESWSIGRMNFPSTPARRPNICIRPTRGLEQLR